MKRIVLALLVAAIVIPAASALDLGEFPLGSWFDANWDAIWEFSSNNIRILAPDGTVHYDFGAVEVQNWKYGAGGDGPYVEFDCEATGKHYKISKPLLNTKVVLEIVRPDEPDYRVEMEKR
ncbi:MAG: hypothetical protein JXA15_04320 [Spirochaetales bacterium]|nr:hypothetical protein [Spirochaetales bacterium]